MADELAYVFGPFRLDPVKRILWRGTAPVTLTSRAFDTLVVLLQNRGETVEKEALIERVWRGAAVEENNLTQCISTLRKALGEGRSNHQYIVTIPGRGYRFVADVQRRAEDGLLPYSPGDAEERAEAASDAHSAIQVASPVELVTARDDLGIVSPAAPGVPGAIHSPRWPYAVLLASGGILVLAILVAFWSRKAATPLVTPARSQAGLAEHRTTLAVLPFEDLSGDPGRDYLSNGLTQEIITQLGRRNAGQLGVIARTSVMRYGGANKSVRRIARELGAEYVIEGSLRQSNGRVRISVQLIRASDQTYVWAQSYERPLGNVLELETEVARDIQEGVSRRLHPPMTSASPVVNSEAQEAYLRGIYFFNRRDGAGLKKAVDSFQQAIRGQPDYAMAYAGLANSYTLLALYGMNRNETAANAKAAALKAVALDDSLAEAHTALGAAKALFDWDWLGAGRDFRRALSINPNDELAHHWYAAFYLAPQGRSAESVAEMELARKLDPPSLIANTDLGWAYFISGRYDEAFRQYRRALDLDANFVPIHFRLAEYYLVKEMYADWAREVAEDDRLSGDTKQASEVERAYRRSGYQGVLMAQLDLVSAHGNRPSFSTALDDALLNRKNAAIHVLSAMCDHHEPALLYIKVDPTLAGLRPDPKFQAIERRMGLKP